MSGAQSPGSPRAPHDGLFPPGGITRRINRERTLLLGGGCALLLQLAHPLVAAGVADHSDFRDDPLKRLRRTLDATLAIVFGTAAEAERAAAGIRAVHARVRGTLPSAVGRFPAGTTYSAEDPELLVWVNATLFDTSIRTYELMFGALDDGDLERYHADSGSVGRLLGVPEGTTLPSYASFRAWWSARLTDGELAVGAQARDLAAAVMTPRLRFVPKPAFAPLSLMTLGLLPAPVRDLFGFRWSPARERAFRAEARALGLVVGALPQRLRVFPQALEAERRASEGGFG
jgi:uncharacterized protein (DUF2236 family)